MKNQYFRLLALVCLTAAALCACSKGETDKKEDKAAEETQDAKPVIELTDQASDVASDAGAEIAATEAASDAAENAAAGDFAGANTENKAALPPYEYPGPEAFYTVLYKYLIDEYGGNYDKSDVTIPCPIIVAEDYSNNDDILVWGNFWIYNYDLKGDILENTSGGSYPGLIHIKSIEGGPGYEVTGMELVADGSDYTPTAKKIFGEHYDDFIKSNADAEGNEATRAQIIANYAAANGLNITAYQDYGWDPVTLPEENIDNFYSIL